MVALFVTFFTASVAARGSADTALGGLDMPAMAAGGGPDFVMTTGLAGRRVGH